MNKRWLVLLACWLFVLAFGGAGAYRLVRSFHEAATKEWPSCPGRIIDSDVQVREGSRHGGAIPVVTYRYWIDDLEYTGTRITIYEECYRARESAEAAASQFPPESEVTVYYDPSAPQSSCLCPGLDKEHRGLVDLAIWMVPGALIGMAILLVFPGPIATTILDTLEQRNRSQQQNARSRERSSQ